MVFKENEKRLIEETYEILKNLKKYENIKDISEAEKIVERLREIIRFHDYKYYV